MTEDPRRHLPSVERLLQSPEFAPLLAQTPRALVVAGLREVLARVRTGRAAPPEHWAPEVEERIRLRTAPSLHEVINATGVVLHTNLGRAPLARAAWEAMAGIASGYSTLEFDLATGARGSRLDHCAGTLSDVTGAEAALVVNNAAGALVLTLNALAAGREVLLSRGELIEIGGSFRIPDILARSGARLREVGTTNRTHLEDYREAIGPETGAVLTVHRSNFEQRGFVTSPAPAALAELAHQHGLPYLYDVGSGLLADLAPFGLRGEPRVADAVAAGADLTLFSGDKLLGGPQAGCVVGRRDAVARARRNPLARALRADKFTLAALEATLGLYRDPQVALQEVPVLRMLVADPRRLADSAERLRGMLAPEIEAITMPGMSAVGGGSFPDAALPTTVIAIDPSPLGADGLAVRLRLGTPSVVCRVADGKVLLDPRTIPEERFPEVADAVRVAATI